MMTILQHIIPIALGFFAKLLAIKSQQAHDQNKLMLEVLAAKEGALEKAREQSNNESPMAAWNRRILMLIILALVAVYPIAGLIGVDTVVEVKEEPTSFLFGLFEFGGGSTFQTVKGLFKFEEIFQWATMIVEFYFGGQLAKGR